MEVFSTDWLLDDQPSRVAVKRVSREYAPVRNKNLSLEQDNLYLKELEFFHTKVEDMMQEIRIMARVSGSSPV